MPRRTSTPSDFGELTRNEFLRYPGGIMLLSDIGQAGDAMQFGGEAAAPRASVPYTRSTTGEPQVQVWNNQTEGGVLHWNGRPIVESGVEIDPAQTGQDNYDSTQPFFSLPHQAVDFPSGPVYEPTRSQFQELPGRTYGEPSVETPTATPTNSNLDNEPSLFGNNPVNPFDEWWKMNAEPTVTGYVSGGTQLDLSGDAGSMWSEMTAPEAAGAASIGPQESFGAGASADIPEAVFNPVPEQTGTPIEPDALPQDYEWTTSPEDRRFLQGNEPSESSSSGPASDLDIRTFGITPTNHNISLGAFLNTPLANMNFGGGYPTVGAGRTDVNDQSGATTNWNSVRQQWERYNPTTQEFEAVGGRSPSDVRDNASNPPVDDNAYGEPGDFNAWPRGELLSPQPPAGMHIIGHDTQNGQPIYEDENGNRFVNPGTGTPAILPNQIGQGQYYDWGSSGIRSLHEIPTARTGSANNPGYGQTGLSFLSTINERMSADMGAATYARHADMPNNFSIGGMRLDPEGGFEQVSFARVGGNTRLRSAATDAWSRSLQAASTGRGQWPTSQPSPGRGG